MGSPDGIYDLHKAAHIPNLNHEEFEAVHKTKRFYLTLSKFPLGSRLLWVAGANGASVLAGNSGKHHCSKAGQRRGSSWGLHPPPPSPPPNLVWGVFLPRGPLILFTNVTRYEDRTRTKHDIGKIANVFPAIKGLFHNSPRGMPPDPSSLRILTRSSLLPPPPPPPPPPPLPLPHQQRAPRSLCLFLADQFRADRLLVMSPQELTTHHVILGGRLRSAVQFRSGFVPK